MQAVRGPEGVHHAQPRTGEARTAFLVHRAGAATRSAQDSGGWDPGLGVRLRVTESSPTWLCIPGLGLEDSAWRAAGHVGATVRLLPGYGLRPRRHDDLRPAALGARLAAELDRPTVLLGHSASCQVVAHTAALAPEHVRAVVLVGPTTDPRAATWPRLAGRWLRTAAHERPTQVPLLARSYARTGPVWMRRAMDAARREDVRHGVCQLTAPVLVVRGRHDRICPSTWAREIASLGPAGSAAVTLPAGAHMVPLTHADLLADAVVRWLDGLPRGG